MKAYTVDTATNRLQPPSVSGNDASYDAGGQPQRDAYTSGACQDFDMTARIGWWMRKIV